LPCARVVAGGVLVERTLAVAPRASRWVPTAWRSRSAATSGSTQRGVPDCDVDMVYQINRLDSRPAS